MPDAPASPTPSSPSDRPLLMIPGPVELSPAVLAAQAAPPPGHTAPALIAVFGEMIEAVRRIWLAEPASQPFIVGGGGTLAMDMAVANLIAPGDRVVVVETGYFSQRMTEMLRRRGAQVIAVSAPAGGVPSVAEVEAAVARASDEAPAGPPLKALFATHVDTSTGVRIDPPPLARLARERGMLAIFDGVCAAAGEPFEMAEWDADLYFTASQKALGAPPGLALMAASPRALAARQALAGTPPPMYLDWLMWQPIMKAYEERRPAYFSTPPTSLINALAAALREIEAEGGVQARVARHAETAAALHAAWHQLGLTLLPHTPDLAANTLSALCLPAGSPVAAEAVVAAIAAQGVTVASGLLPDIKSRYFRVGHMGWVISQPQLLRRTVEAIASALRSNGVAGATGSAGGNEPAAVAALSALRQPPAS